MKWVTCMDSYAEQQSLEHEFRQRVNDSTLEEMQAFLKGDGSGWRDAGVVKKLAYNQARLIRYTERIGAPERSKVAHGRLLILCLFSPAVAERWSPFLLDDVHILKTMRSAVWLLTGQFSQEAQNFLKTNLEKLLEESSPVGAEELVTALMNAVLSGSEKAADLLVEVSNSSVLGTGTVSWHIETKISKKPARDLLQRLVKLHSEELASLPPETARSPEESEKAKELAERIDILVRDLLKKFSNSYVNAAEDIHELTLELARIGYAANKSVSRQQVKSMRKATGRHRQLLEQGCLTLGRETPSRPVIYALLAVLDTVELETPKVDAAREQAERLLKQLVLEIPGEVAGCIANNRNYRQPGSRVLELERFAQEELARLAITPASLRQAGAVRVPAQPNLRQPGRGTVPAGQ
ncbi:Uncharacterised protein [Candidatus Burarchaeum australiense]|nr:Uncharacterised protein [Candidatus Burarchaeum australiense]